MTTEIYPGADADIEAGVRSLVKTLGVLALTVALGIPAALYSGFVLQDLWGWFVAPLGVPQIGLIQAVGLLLIVALVRRTPKGGHSEVTFGKAFSNAANRIVFVSLGWGVGAAWHSFMPA